ncbi:HpcH/HpaI aldolase family protein [Vreelandella aquamarina]|uniref:HpcH/HpaI aldolase family protein n=1 Tax=Vreelandella aquamarina TaxID=77097 RepID=UPI001D184418|nr:HpcH/HpaI aldolase/citrate lyase family protein [Halomonas meridiana]MCC4289099.1 HpcH/HpaI aldolase/citrate lyase family protein [Halomonas meridiana]
MKLPENSFKKRLKNGPQFGCWASFGTGFSAEILATIGFDWLLVDGEHVPNTVPMVLSQLQAVAPYESHPVVRAVNGDKDLIKQLLDIGVQTLMVPMVETAEQARELVRAMRYPPLGVRGVGGGLARATRWDSIPDYLEKAHEELCLIVQVESRKGVENAAEIAAVEGVDAVFIGPADLSIGLGHPGNPGHPEVQESIQSVIAATNSAGKACGILAPVEADAKRYLELGCSFIAVAIDISAMRQALKDTLSCYRDSDTGAKPSSLY